MNNQLDFFAEYEGQKRRAERIFESLDTKLDRNHSQLDEALFGLIGGKKKKQDNSNWDSLSPEEQEKTFESHFEIALQNIEDKDLRIDFGGGKIVYVDELTQEQKEDALEMFKKQASKFKYKPSFVESKGFLVYDSKSATDDQKSQTDQTQDASSKYKLTYNKKEKKYFFGNERRKVSIIRNALSELDVYKWDKSPLKFMFEDSLSFDLEDLSFDFNEGTIRVATGGYWFGNFVGTATKDVDFKGNAFKGMFFGNNDSWISKPTAFVDGKFIDYSKTGLLGLKNVVQATENNSFHLIQLPANYSIEILTDKQIRHTITCQKRLDNINSNFVYFVYSGYEIDQSEPKKITLLWENIRKNYNAYKVSKKMTSLPELFSLNSGENIIELRVVEAGTPPSFKKKEKFDETKEYIENTANLEGLKKVSGSKYNRNFKFDITNDSDLENLNKIKGYVNSPQFENDLKKASVYLDNSLISLGDIKSKFPYLVNVFTEDVLSEAYVDLTRRGSRRNYGWDSGTTTRSSSVKNPLTNKPFTAPYEISDYLNQKYKSQIEQLGGRKPKEYDQDYKNIYNAVFGDKGKNSTNAPSSTTSSKEVTSSKEEDAVLKRLESFVKHFVYKIDDGKNTNQTRKYFIDLLKSKVSAHKEPITKQTSAQATQTTAATTAPTQTTTATTPKKGAIGKVQKESLVRNEIRKILKEIL